MPEEFSVCDECGNSEANHRMLSHSYVRRNEGLWMTGLNMSTTTEVPNADVG
jgi:hypothetical protein